VLESKIFNLNAFHSKGEEVTNKMIKQWLLAGVTGISLLASVGTVAAQEFKIGLVNSERILREAQVARVAEQRLETEFAKRDKEMQDLGARLRTLAEKLEKESAVLSETERGRRQREVAELDRDLQRKQREFREDLTQRRTEEMAQIQERAQRIIRQIAETEKFDLIVQEAIYFSARVDITDRVIRALNAAR
jgi:outer membrane protein